MRVAARWAYAGIVSRALAFVVDATVVVAVVIGTVVVVEVIGSVAGNRVRDLARTVVPVFAVALPALFASYNAAFWWLVGRTPGMALLGVRVVGTGGRPASLASALIRAAVLAVFPIVVLWCLVDRRCQAVHDKLARTVVVRAVAADITPRRGPGAGTARKASPAPGTAGPR